MMYSCTELSRNKQEYVGASRTGVHVRSFAIHLLSAGRRELAIAVHPTPAPANDFAPSTSPLADAEIHAWFSLSAKYPGEICLRNELLD